MARWLDLPSGERPGCTLSRAFLPETDLTSSMLKHQVRRQYTVRLAPVSCRNRIAARHKTRETKVAPGGAGLNKHRIGRAAPRLTETHPLNRSTLTRCASKSKRGMSPSPSKFELEWGVGNNVSSAPRAGSPLMSHNCLCVALYTYPTSEEPMLCTKSIRGSLCTFEVTTS